MKIRHEIINKTKAAKYCNNPYKIKITRGAIEAFLNGKLVHCHHVKGVGVPKKQLIDDNMYYDRPADDLIIISKSEHSRLHMEGKKHSEETKKKISEASKGNTCNKGKAHSTDSRQKISDSLKAYWAKRKEQLN